MAKLTLLHDPDPILRLVADDVREFGPRIEKLVADMRETMHAVLGVGLAAPQVGVSLRVLVAEFEGMKGVPPFRAALCNPVIVKSSERKVIAAEGCLSIPGKSGDVERHLRIKIKGQTPAGKPVMIEAEGYFARVLQHEIDHLNGILYIDRLVDGQLRQLESAA
jgi:peptide deformylase